MRTGHTDTIIGSQATASQATASQATASQATLKTPSLKWTLVAGVALASLAGGCNKGATGGASTGGTTSLSSGAVATVNGQEINRDDFHRYLEVAAGERALPQLIDYELVMQELKKQNISLADTDVQTTFDKLVEQRKKQAGANQEQFDLLVKSDAGSEALKRNIRQDLAINAILTKDIKVDDAALKTWFDKNHARYDTPAQVKIGLLLSSTKTRADLMAQQLKAKSKTFEQLVDEQQKANDPVAAGSVKAAPNALPVSTLKQTLEPALGPVLTAQVAKMKTGENSTVVAVGAKAPPAFVIVHVVSRDEAKKADLTTMKSQAETDYKLEQVARRVVTKNPKNPPFEQTIKQVETAVMQQMAQSGETATPAYRDVLNYILNGEKQKLMTRLRQTSKIIVPDAIYTNVAKAYAPAPAGGASMPGATTPGAPSGTPSGAAPSGAAPSGAAPSAPPASSAPR